MKPKNLVIHEYDPNTPLTSAQVAELEALEAISDDKIDTSDIPPLTEKFWKNAKRNPLCRPVQALLTVNLDVDILDWLKSAGSEYQTKLNAILRQAMLDEGGKRRKLL